MEFAQGKSFTNPMPTLWSEKSIENNIKPVETSYLTTERDRLPINHDDYI